jgi:citrate lyase alpha subunit
MKRTEERGQVGELPDVEFKSCPQCDEPMGPIAGDKGEAFWACASCGQVIFDAERTAYEANRPSDS